MPELAQRCNAIVERCECRFVMQPYNLKIGASATAMLISTMPATRADRLVMLDFDWCGPGFSIFDLSTFRWAPRISTLKASRGIFIEEYLKIRPSSCSSLPLLRLFMILRHLWHIAQSIRPAALNSEYLLTHEALDDLISQ